MKIDLLEQTIPAHGNAEEAPGAVQPPELPEQTAPGDGGDALQELLADRDRRQVLGLQEAVGHHEPAVPPQTPTGHFPGQLRNYRFPGKLDAQEAGLVRDNIKA